MSENQNNVDSGSILIPRISLVETHTGAKSEKSGRHSKKTNVIWKYLAYFGLIVLAFFLIVTVLSYNVYKKAILVKASFDGLESAVKEQNLEKVKVELGNTKNNLTDLKKAYQIMNFIKFVPLVGGYYSDGVHALDASDYALQAGDTLAQVVEPYADIIGFDSKSQKPESGQQTTQERIDFVIKTIPDLMPKADVLIEKASLVKKEIDQIDPDRYPEKFRDKEIKSNLVKLINLVDQGVIFIKNGKPLLEASPYLLGVNEERKYMVLFQNDKELRPTGGFLTAYSIAKVNKGRFEPVLSSDIYNLDSTYKGKVDAPEAFIKYLKGPYVLSNDYRLRDMNWSPDFEESMKLFTKEAKSVGIKDIDGIIAVDTQVLVNLLDVIGPISVPGFGDFSTKQTPECRCPQVIYELESFADIEGPVVWSQDEPGKIIFAPPNYDNRKKIIGPLMNSILANALGQPKEKLPSLFDALMKSLTEKHILFYVFDNDTQKALTEFGIAGTITDYKDDYLLINDANLGGRKSNLYVTQEVNQEVEIAKDGSVTKKVTITYKNPEKFDGWLNSVLPNWVRIYVPKDSELISFDGVEDKQKPYKEFEKSVFAGYFQLRPQGVAKISLKYKLPMKVKKEYRIFLQKQPGKDNVLYTFKVGKKSEEFNLRTDRELVFKI